MTDDSLARRAAAVRRFNRIHTRRIGLLPERYLGTAYPLAAVRLIFELGDRGEAIAADLARELGVDPGYLSRLVRRLRHDGLIARRAASSDRRQVLLTLTAAGMALFAEVNQRSQDEIATLLAAMPERAQARLVDTLQEAGTLLEEPNGTAPLVILRAHQPGDMGWVVEAHGRLYAREYGWDSRFEALVAEIVAGFLREYDPARERCWIAERAGVPVGSVFVVRQDGETAKLRLLLVEPAARGLGLGRRLVQECIRFARAAGYRRMRLWTNDVLVAARAIYQAEGFRLIEQAPHADFGPPTVGETWELAL